MRGNEGAEMKKAVWIALMVALMLGPAALGLSQPYRDNLVLPANEIYQKMLGYALDKEFEKVERSLQLTKPVTQAMNSKFKVNIEAEIKNGLDKKDQEQVIRGIQRLIWLDMKDMMSLGTDVAQESQDKAAAKFKSAFLDYLLLSPYIQTKSFSSDQKIKNNFRKTVVTANSAEDFRRPSEEIEQDLMTAFPELKR